MAGLRRRLLRRFGRRTPKWSTTANAVVNGDDSFARHKPNQCKQYLVLPPRHRHNFSSLVITPTLVNHPRGIEPQKVWDGFLVNACTLMELGVGEARTADGDRHPAPPQLFVHGLGEAGDERLGRAVGRHRWCGLKRRCRSDVDDRPAVRAQQRQQHLHRQVLQQVVQQVQQHLPRHHQRVVQRQVVEHQHLHHLHHRQQVVVLHHLQAPVVHHLLRHQVRVVLLHLRQRVRVVHHLHLNLNLKVKPNQRVNLNLKVNQKKRNQNLSQKKRKRRKNLMRKKKKRKRTKRNLKKKKKRNQVT